MRAADELLRGAIDLHLHAAPDVVPRSVDAVEAAAQAREAGLRAIVLKSHGGDTAPLAALVSRLTGFPVFGGVTLNRAVGGPNPHAVRESGRRGGRVVWLPTTDAAALAPSAADLAAVAEAAAKTGAILATGHLAPPDGLALLRAAGASGVERTVVTHPHASFVGYSVEQMREAAALGALLELDAVFTTEPLGAEVSFADLADLAHTLGPARCVLASDGGQAANPPPVELLRRALAGFLEAGLSPDELRTMVAENPARLLGLEPQ